MMAGKVTVFMVIAAAVLLGGGRPTMAADAPTNYRFYCVQCHGTKGDGKGINTTAEALTVTPQNHRDASSMGKHSDAELRKVIAHGGESLAESHLMPPWAGVLSDAEIDQMVTYLRELCSCAHGAATKLSK